MNLSSVLCLAWLLILMMATSALSQTQNTIVVVDTNGYPVQSGVEYYILPAGTNSGGGLTVVNLNNSCPLYVGQQYNSAGLGLPATIIPYNRANYVAANTDSTVTFNTRTVCSQSTEWAVGRTDPTTGRRLITVGSIYGVGNYSNYFRIEPTQFRGTYYIQWCPRDVCPYCNFNCGTVGTFAENGVILAALDVNALAVQFERA